MGTLQPEQFDQFFGELYQDAEGKPLTPFPWQRMLVQHVAERGWPEGIDLPTASGKTACIDAAVFLLAMGEQHGRLALDHPARRRIFFVVDRRIVVDEAFERAQRLADKLSKAKDGIVKQVADRLRALAGRESPEPLIASRLRGGTVKDERWRLSPAQPAIITSTVDQLGSRLLFRSYGSSNLSAPIEAALTACDSLILLDEAHCAVPFMQTTRAVQRYAGKNWMEDESIVSPLTFSILSATLPEDVTEIFPSERDRTNALRHDLLHQRINAAKPAELIQVNDTGDSDDKLIVEAVKHAQHSVSNGRCRIAVMVNRVARASRIVAELRELTAGEKPKLNADVVLMTGRMRPIDRDRLVERWSPHLKAGSETQPEKPIILVTTQCLEVGADFSFDALITECASLDALRQRFGRLNRLGEYDETDAAILVRKADLGAKADDPIYGTALKDTWGWLNEHAVKDDRFNFGITAVDALFPDDADEHKTLLKKLNAPSLDAPVMLPAHVDLLCQTAPPPTPDPDVAIFLHGPQRSVPEARVVFRADLVETAEQKWRDIVSLLPPLTAEALTLPLWLIRKWLAPHEQSKLGDLSDVEGQRSNAETTEATFGQPFVIWRGQRDSVVSNNPQDVRPNETVVVPADEKLAAELSHCFCRPEDTPLDVAEQAYPAGRKQHVLRLLPAVYRQSGIPPGLAKVVPLQALFAWAADDDRETSELDDLLDALLQHSGDEDADVPVLPTWLRDAAKNLKKRRRPVENHPTGRLVLVGQIDKDAAALDLDFGDMDDALSMIGQPVSLSDHVDHVKTRAETWAQRCLPASMANLFAKAAELHDVGKADPRFQIILHGDELEAAVKRSKGELLAKSDGLYRSPALKRRLRAAAGLPDDFRHEMLSIQLAEAANSELPDDLKMRHLVLHLIGSHHGHGRPFAPVCIDGELPNVYVDGFELPHARRCELIPPHRLDSGVAERFWKLTRHYGWWGLAYLEAILRLADHAASATEAAVTQRKEVPR